MKKNILLYSICIICIIHIGFADEYVNHTLSEKIIQGNILLSDLSTANTTDLLDAYDISISSFHTIQIESYTNNAFHTYITPNSSSQIVRMYTPHVTIVSNTSIHLMFIRSNQSIKEYAEFCLTRTCLITQNYTYMQLIPHQSSVSLISSDNPPKILNISKITDDSIISFHQIYRDTQNSTKTTDILFSAQPLRFRGNLHQLQTDIITNWNTSFYSDNDQNYSFTLLSHNQTITSQSRRQHAFFDTSQSILTSFNTIQLLRIQDFPAEGRIHILSKTSINISDVPITQQALALGVQEEQIYLWKNKTLAQKHTHFLGYLQEIKTGRLSILYDTSNTHNSQTKSLFFTRMHNSISHYLSQTYSHHTQILPTNLFYRPIAHIQIPTQIPVHDIILRGRLREIQADVETIAPRQRICEQSIIVYEQELCARWIMG
ncbi:MAG: hypothetical protein ACMXYA_00605 [Candidatus Woesearchaeota archaeon]